MKILFFVLLLSVTSLNQSWARSQTDFALGIGVSKLAMSLEEEGRKSQFMGWAPSLEVGVLFPFTDRFGLCLFGGIEQFDLSNSSDSSTFMEQGSGLSTSGKVGFTIGSFALGVGQSKDSLKIKQVSTVNSSTESSIEGTSSLIFLNYGIEIKGSSRLVFEAQYHTGKFDSFDYTQNSVGMKFFVLF